MPLPDPSVGDVGQFDGGALAFPNYWWRYVGPITVGTPVPAPAEPGAGWVYYVVAPSFDDLYNWSYISGEAFEALAAAGLGSVTNGPCDTDGECYALADTDAGEAGLPPVFDLDVTTTSAHLAGSRPVRVGTIGAVVVTPVPVMVGGLTGSRPSRTGDVDVWERPLPAPINDDFADALIMDPAGGLDTPDLTWATTETGERDWQLGPAIHTVWYSYTAPADGVLTLLFGPVNNDVDPYPRLFVGLYSGASVDTLVMLAEDNTEREVEVGSSAGTYPGSGLFPGGSTYPSGVRDVDPISPATGVLSVELSGGQQVWIRLGPEGLTPYYSDIDPTTNSEYGPGPAALLWYFTGDGELLGGSSVSNATYGDPGDGILTPGLLSITVANLPPSGTVFWSIDSPTAPSFDETDTDDTGAIIGLSLLIPETLAPGAHTLYGRVSDGSEIKLMFIVAADNPPDTTEDDVPPVLIPRTGVKRWVFQDPTGTIPDELSSKMTLTDGAASYVVPINPQKMNAPFTDKQITTDTTVGVNGNGIVWESNAQRPTLQFNGVILDGDPSDPTSHLSMLNYFLSLPYLIYLIDHFNRAWTVYFTSFQPVPQQSLQHPYRHTYDASAICFQVVQL